MGRGVPRRRVRDVPAAPVLPGDPARAGRRRTGRRGRTRGRSSATSTCRCRSRSSRRSPSSRSCGAGTTCSTRSSTCATCRPYTTTVGPGLLPGPVRGQVAGDDGRRAGQPRCRWSSLFIVAQRQFVRGIALSGHQGLRDGRRRSGGETSGSRDYRPREHAPGDVARRRSAAVPGHRRPQPSRPDRRSPATWIRAADGAELGAAPRHAPASRRSSTWTAAGARSLRREVERLAASVCRAAFVVFAASTTTAWASDAAFGETEAARLRDSARSGARGAEGLEAAGPAGAGCEPGVWCASMTSRLDPLWATAGELACRCSSTSPIRSPSSSRSTPRTSATRSCASTRTGTSGRPGRGPPGRGPGFPPFDELIDGLEAVVGPPPAARRSSVPTSGARRRTSRWVSAMLERCPNFAVDIAATAGRARPPAVHGPGLLRALGRPDPVRDGRAPRPAARTPCTFRFLETFDESFDYGTDEPPGQGRWQVNGLGLPAEVLRTRLRGNARRLIRLG